MRRKFFKGQSTAEYAVLLVIATTALIAMQVYFKRGLQGRIRDLADHISTTHYELNGTTSTFTMQHRGRLDQQYVDGIAHYEIPEKWVDGATQRHGESFERWGNQTVVPEEEDD